MQISFIKLPTQIEIASNSHRTDPDIYRFKAGTLGHNNYGLAAPLSQHPLVKQKFEICDRKYVSTVMFTGLSSCFLSFFDEKEEFLRIIIFPELDK